MDAENNRIRRRFKRLKYKITMTETLTWETEDWRIPANLEETLGSHQK